MIKENPGKPLLQVNVTKEGILNYKLNPYTTDLEKRAVVDFLRNFVIEDLDELNYYEGGNNLFDFSEYFDEFGRWKG